MRTSNSISCPQSYLGRKGLRFKLGSWAKCLSLLGTWTIKCPEWVTDVQ